MLSLKIHLAQVALQFVFHTVISVGPFAEIVGARDLEKAFDFGGHLDQRPVQAHFYIDFVQAVQLTCVLVVSHFAGDMAIV